MADENQSLLGGEHYLTDRELSQRLKISRRTLQDYRNNGKLPKPNGAIEKAKKRLREKSLSFLLWCHQESNRGHKDFQSFALPTELWHHRLSGCKGNTFFLNSKYFSLKNHFYEAICLFTHFSLLLRGPFFHQF